ncbi:MAG: Obg family GTPase CgtA [Candidatus Omnitrophota bacterium]
MLIDRVKIEVAAGSGGNGCNSFFKRRGARHRAVPNGGPGGKGADVVMVASRHVRTLRDFTFHRHFKARQGGHGSSNNKNGRGAEDLVIKVPLGTVITDLDTGSLLADLTEEGESVIVAKGAAGGEGNIKSPEATPGRAGEAKTLQLDLKLIADVGIVGFPNSGKSTLICGISRADSKIADYPFTTKEPILGVIQKEEFSIVVADMPGLIKDAHLGKGLGDRFLRHIERTKLLVHLVDMSGVSFQDPMEAYESLNEELALYSPSLAKKEQIIVANKMDLPDAPKNILRFKKKMKKKVLAISALKRHGLEELIEEIRSRL